MQGVREEGWLPVLKAEVGYRSPVGAAVQAEVVAALRRAEGSRRDRRELLVSQGCCEAN